MGSCDVKYPPPVTELCVHNTKDYACIDERLEPEEYNKPFDDVIGYLCTNTDDFGRLHKYCDDMRRKLIKCEIDLEKALSVIKR